MNIDKHLMASIFGIFMVASIAPTAVMAQSTPARSVLPAPKPHSVIAQHNTKVASNAAARTIHKTAKAEPVKVKATTRLQPRAQALAEVRLPGLADGARPLNMDMPAQTQQIGPARLQLAALQPGEVKDAVARNANVGQNGHLWCVPFARAVSGINLQGNAKTWWQQADNHYAKGQMPVVGSVLNFRGSSKMPMGHVAVVSKVISQRRILVDHANWTRNRVSLDMAVIDVSRNNDWSAVRVESIPNTPGDVYPTYGFIYRASAHG